MFVSFTFLGFKARSLQPEVPPRYHNILNIYHLIYQAKVDGSEFNP